MQICLCVLGCPMYFVRYLLTAYKLNNNSFVQLVTKAKFYFQFQFELSLSVTTLYYAFNCPNKEHSEKLV